MEWDFQWRTLLNVVENLVKCLKSKSIWPHDPPTLVGVAQSCPDEPLPKNEAGRGSGQNTAKVTTFYMYFYIATLIVHIDRLCRLQLLRLSISRSELLVIMTGQGQPLAKAILE